MAKVLKQKDINLLLALEKGGSSSQEALRRKKILIILAVVVLVLATAAALYFFKIMSLNNQKEESLSYINDPVVISAYADASAKKGQAEKAAEDEEWLGSLLNTVNGYPRLSSADFSKIYGYAGSRIEIINLEYDDETGTLTLEGSSDSATGIPIFIAQLRTSGLFNDVTYEGYTNTQEQQVTGTTVTPDGTVTDNVVIHDKYTFIANCQVKAGE